MDTVVPQDAPRVVVAHAHPAVRAAVASVLASSRRVRLAAAVATVAEAVAAVEQSRAAVLVIDATLVGGDVGALARSLGAAVILVGLHDERAFEEAALRSGAAAYLVTDSTLDAYLDLIETTADAA